VTPSEIAVSEAPLNAISDPFVGPAKDVRVLAQVPGLGTDQQNWLSAPWFPVAVVAGGVGVIALIASHSSSHEPPLIPPGISP
jgi:hypothetical protein